MWTGSFQEVFVKFSKYYFFRLFLWELYVIMLLGVKHAILISYIIWRKKMIERGIQIEALMFGEEAQQ